MKLKPMTLPNDLDLCNGQYIEYSSKIGISFISTNPLIIKDAANQCNKSRCLILLITLYHMHFEAQIIHLLDYFISYFQSIVCSSVVDKKEPTCMQTEA